MCDRATACDGSTSLLLTPRHRRLPQTIRLHRTSTMCSRSSVGEVLRRAQTQSTPPIYASATFKEANLALVQLILAHIGVADWMCRPHTSSHPDLTIAVAQPPTWASSQTDSGTERCASASARSNRGSVVHGANRFLARRWAVASGGRSR
jgi:hypothetical protein